MRPYPIYNKIMEDSAQIMQSSINKLMIIIHNYLDSDKKLTDCTMS